MFKKILVVCAVSTLFINAAIFAAEPEPNQQIMMPITAGTHTFKASDFDSQGNASFTIPNFVPEKACGMYLSKATPWVTAYPSEVVAGDAPPAPSLAPQNNVAKSLIVTPNCNSAGCALTINFSSEDWYCNPPDCKQGRRYFYSAAKARDTSIGGQDGYLTVTYVAYCSTQPIQSDMGKHEPEQTKLK